MLIEQHFVKRFVAPVSFIQDEESCPPRPPQPTYDLQLCAPAEKHLRLAHISDLRDPRKPFRQIFVRRNIIDHGSVVIGFIRFQIEVAGAGETEDDGLFLAGLLAFQGFVDGSTDRVA